MVRYHDLTRRQQEVTALVADGLTNEEIGTALSISPETVKNHTGAIYERLGFHNVGRGGKRVSLARWYWINVQLPYYLDNGFEGAAPHVSGRFAEGLAHRPHDEDRDSKPGPDNGMDW